MNLHLNPYLAAKTDPQNANLWLSLWIHSRDTAEVMRRLAMHWLSDGARAALELEEATLSKTAFFWELSMILERQLSYFKAPSCSACQRRGFD